MEIVTAGENKNLKYNHATPIDLDTIPKDELEQALMEFAEGSVGLENCLRIMWANGMKTGACCAGERDENEIAYIMMCEGVDLFKFLSDDLLLNDMVVLEDDSGCQVIRFAGEVAEKDRLMQRVAEDVASGVKDNSHLLQDKIGKDFSAEWYLERSVGTMNSAGTSNGNVLERLKEIIDMSDEEFDASMPEVIAVLTEVWNPCDGKKDGKSK